jgi:hypothetical protein
MCRQSLSALARHPPLRCHKQWLSWPSVPQEDAFAAARPALRPENRQPVADIPPLARLVVISSSCRLQTFIDFIDCHSGCYCLKCVAERGNLRGWWYEERIMTEEEKARFEALIQLRDFWQARWVSRRDFAWKVTLGAWALLASSAYFVKKRPPDNLLALALIIYVIIFAFIWVREIQVRDYADSRRSFHFNSHAEAMVFPATTIEPKPTDQGLFEFLRDRLAIAQVLATVLLAVGVYYFMGRLG